MVQSSLLIFIMVYSVAPMPTSTKNTITLDARFEDFGRVRVLKLLMPQRQPRQQHQWIWQKVPMLLLLHPVAPHGDMGRLQLRQVSLSLGRHHILATTTYFSTTSTSDQGLNFEQFKAANICSEVAAKICFDGMDANREPLLAIVLFGFQTMGMSQNPRWTTITTASWLESQRWMRQSSCTILRLKEYKKETFSESRC